MRLSPARNPGVTRRGFLAGTGALLLAPQRASGATARFPVTVEHALGRTEIASPPRRVVTVGYGDECALLALGMKPLGIVRSGMFESGITPWCAQRFGADIPLLLEGGMTDYEMVADLAPDLVLGVFSGLDSVSYGRLSRIAPTVAYQSGPWQASWHEQTRLAGAALGRAEEAEQLVVQTEGLLKGYGDRWPALRGRSFTFATFFPGRGDIVVYLPGETRVDWLIQLGMVPSEGVRQLASRNPGRVSVDVSLEVIDSVGADLLVMWLEKSARAVLEAQSLFRLFEPVRRGRCFIFDDPASIWAASWPNVLSIPYAFPAFLPRMEAALKA